MESELEHGLAFDEIRQYSLSGKIAEPYLRISTKLEFRGLVSNHLHGCDKGAKVLLQSPTGVFTLNPQAKKHVLISAGVGFTPIISILYDALNVGVRGQDVIFVQCSRNQENIILKDEISTVTKDQNITYKTVLDEDHMADHTGYLNKEIMKKWLDEGDFHPDGQTDIYFCGPKSFMSEINKMVHALGYNTAHIHLETFGPLLAI
ncbi:MAG: nitric oxide dioxygenase [Flavobacteriales bacterium]